MVDDLHSDRDGLVHWDSWPIRIAASSSGSTERAGAQRSSTGICRIG